MGDFAIIKYKNHTFTVQVYYLLFMSQFRPALDLCYRKRVKEILRTKHILTAEVI
jgi:hypothetical protein